MRTDLLYLCHGRLEFTKKTLPTLIETTDWDLVNRFVIYNDAAPDLHETTKYLKTEIELPQGTELRLTNLSSPVGVMKHFIHRTDCDLFAKIDNDIMAPPGWLQAMTQVMKEDPDLELLGMEAGMSDRRSDQLGERWTWTPSSHIGGVGLMRRSAFTSRRLPNADGRFGFTEWQHRFSPACGWIEPDLRVFSLDQLPFNPWRGITLGYMGQEGLQRAWPTYPDDGTMDDHWAWAGLECE